MILQVSHKDVRVQWYGGPTLLQRLAPRQVESPVIKVGLPGGPKIR